jgi:hypothetical protein
LLAVVVAVDIQMIVVVEALEVLYTEQQPTYQAIPTILLWEREDYSALREMMGAIPYLMAISQVVANKGLERIHLLQLSLMVELVE